MKHRMKTVIGVVAVLSLVGIAVAMLNPGHEPRTSPAASTSQTDNSHNPSAKDVRTVLVGKKSALGENNGTLRVGYQSGAQAPVATTDATVTTDENCTPDADGVSHCSNDIRLADGKKIRVEHAHRMHDVPCLVPGERVQLRAA